MFRVWGSRVWGLCKVLGSGIGARGSGLGVEVLGLKA